MPEYYPKISERQTDELIEIANSTNEFWQQDAIDQAKIELIKGILQKNSKMIFFTKKQKKLMVILKTQS